ncbi:hypothetical protein M0R45_024282 [Rubus argutus]|uniref:Uncharacterized protein n=1 Tax=Rubus argutus TaxID=59490 RepID=A0AAW1WQN8_RUBAR
MSARKLFDVASYSAEWAVQSTLSAVSFGLLQHIPLRGERLDGPKSVRSKLPLSHGGNANAPLENGPFAVTAGSSIMGRQCEQKRQ